MEAILRGAAAGTGDRTLQNRNQRIFQRPGITQKRQDTEPGGFGEPVQRVFDEVAAMFLHRKQ